MLGGHLPELIIIVVLALLIVGPGKLPQLGSALGGAIRGVREGFAADRKEAEDERSEPARQS